MADEYVVDNNKFRSVDTTKIGEFIDRCPEFIKEFKEIKEKFDEINENLLKEWDGSGSDEYEKEANSILSKIGDLETVLNEITDGTIKDLRKAYSDFDEEMGKFNQNPYSEEGGNG